MSAASIPAATLHGLIAEYDTPEQVLHAAEAARKAGYTKMDTYTPHPIEGLDDALDLKPTRLGFAVLAIGLIGAATGFGMQWYAGAEFYPLNIGGRPMNPWPNYIVITFEVTVLLSAFTAGLLMLARNGLPRLYHPVFNAPGFERATRDGYYLCVEAVDPRFDPAATHTFLEGTDPVRVEEVAR
ncbi:MAG: DUF3341 domain-containing protein [Trueperaceae bacterium]|nr:DUF3341 domain-containing protein [Trueperaceae bacterium]